MMYLLAFLLLTEPTPRSSSKWNNPESEAYQKPCETDPYFAANGSLAIGGLPFEKADIANVAIVIDEYSNAPAITISLSSTGHVKFLKAQQITIGQPMPICLNNKTISNPILVEFIQGKEVYLSGGFKVEEASDLRAKIITALQNPKTEEN